MKAKQTRGKTVINRHLFDFFSKSFAKSKTDYIYAL
jgi:hypothetical protein